MNQEHIPTIKEMICLPVILEAVPSPSGNKVAYVITKTNWSKNTYKHECHIHFKDKNKSVLLTHASKISNLKWIDDNSLALIKSLSSGKEIAQKPQIWVYNDLVGDGFQVTYSKSGVEGFDIYNVGFIFAAENEEKKYYKKKEEKYGSHVVRIWEEPGNVDLFYTSQERIRQYIERKSYCDTKKEEEKVVQPTINLTDGHNIDYHITSFVVAPKTGKIFLNCRKKKDLAYIKETITLSLEVDVESALDEYIKEKEKEKEKIQEKDDKKEKDEKSAYVCGGLEQLKLPPGASITDISPDEQFLLISWSKELKFYSQDNLYALNIGKLSDEILCKKDLKEHLLPLTENFDRYVLKARWTEKGIFFNYYDYSTGKIALIANILSPSPKPINMAGYNLYSGFEANEKGDITTVAATIKSYLEVIQISEDKDQEIFSVCKLTDFTSKINNWSIGTIESIEWKSKDGTLIEGVLRKPADFDSNKKYPLVLVIHGGPSWLSHCVPLTIGDLRYYPTIQFTNKDILVLYPNYRGSIGRGEEFLKKNVNNLGVGDLWDIESAIDYLVKRGFVDESKVGCMGWSQGGYISAYATTHSEKFVACSVGAGISSWYTYYMGTDIPDFTLDYLSASPFEQPEIYDKTAPIKKIKEAKTPTLIQHGTNDQRVPFLNATELFRGLKERGVPVELFAFEEMQHGITKPKGNRAVMEQNLTWFLHYILGEPLDFFDQQE